MTGSPWRWFTLLDRRALGLILAMRGDLNTWQVYKPWEKNWMVCSHVVILIIFAESGFWSQHETIFCLLFDWTASRESPLCLFSIGSVPNFISCQPWTHIELSESSVICAWYVWLSSSSNDTIFLCKAFSLGTETGYFLQRAKHNCQLLKQQTVFLFFL